MAEEKKQATPSDEISLKELILKLQDFVRYLRSKWVIILIAGTIGGSLGLIYSILKRTQYIATLTFALEEKSSGSSLSTYAGLASQFGIDLGNGNAGGVFSGDNIMELMKSRRMVTRALLSGINVNGKEESLAQAYINTNHLGERLKRLSKLPESIPFPMNLNPDSLSYIQDSLIGSFYNRIIKNNLTVDKPNTKLSIIAVACKSPNELFAKYFTEALVKNVSLFYIQTKTKRASANVDILQSRLDSVKLAYNNALFSTALSADKNMDPIRAVVNVPRIRNQSNAQILAAEYAELTKNLEMAKMTLLQETPLIQIIDRPVLPLNKIKIGHPKGIVFGTILFMFITVIFLILGFSYREIMK